MLPPLPPPPVRTLLQDLRAADHVEQFRRDGVLAHGLVLVCQFRHSGRPLRGKFQPLPPYPLAPAGTVQRNATPSLSPAAK